MIDYTKNDIYKMNKSKEQDKDFICVQGWDIGTPNKGAFRQTLQRR
jgi:hypothetical protein